MEPGASGVSSATAVLPVGEGLSPELARAPTPPLNMAAKTATDSPRNHRNATASLAPVRNENYAIASVITSFLSMEVVSFSLPIFNGELINTRSIPNHILSLFLLCSRWSLERVEWVRRLQRFLWGRGSVQNSHVHQPCPSTWRQGLRRTRRGITAMQQPTMPG